MSGECVSVVLDAVHGKACLSYEENCQAIFGDHAYVDDNGECHCLFGYVLGASSTCVAAL